MKKFAMLTILFASLAASHLANAAIDPATERDLVKVCKALQGDSRLQLQKAVKRSRVGYKQLAKGLVCNGKSAIDFAMMHNATKNADYLARKANIESRGLLAKR